MISLKRDLFARLAISAKALKEDKPHKLKTQPSRLEMADFTPVAPTRVQQPKRIEETIEEVVENPQIKALEKELDAAEQVFESLKEKGENLDFLMRIERKIAQLKKIIDEKNYY